MLSLKSAGKATLMVALGLVVLRAAGGAFPALANIPVLGNAFR